MGIYTLCILTLINSQQNVILSEKINISIKKNKIERIRNENAIWRTAKGGTYDKGAFVVQPSMVHGKELGHSNSVRRFRGLVLCHALVSVFAVLAIFAVYFFSPLPCDPLCHVLVVCFAVRVLFVMRCCGLTR
jgi:hypothetical protein